MLKPWLASNALIEPQNHEANGIVARSNSCICYAARVCSSIQLCMAPDCSAAAAVINDANHYRG
jgi:hypothetical protein